MNFLFPLLLQPLLILFCSCKINNNRWNPQAFYVLLGRKKSTTFLMILRKVYKKREKVSNLRYSPSSPYFYKFTVGASLCTILISSLHHTMHDSL